MFDASHEHHHWLKDPIRYLPELQKKGLNLHIHYDGLGFDPTYMDCRYDPFLCYEHETIPPLVRSSGLHPLGTSLLMEDCSFPIYHLPGSTVPFIRCEKNTISKPMMDYIYQHSIEPTSEEIQSKLPSKESYSFAVMNAAVGHVTQSELFKKYKGIHYHIVCRDPCDEVDPYITQSRRRHSNKQDISILMSPGYMPLTYENIHHAVDVYLTSSEHASFAPIGTWNVEHLHTLSNLFSGNDEFNEDISAWNVSNIHWMTNMFKNARGFNQSLHLWNPQVLITFGASNSAVTRLFKLPPTLTVLDIRGCRELHHLDFNVDELHEELIIECQDTKLDADTIARMIQFYTTRSTLPESRKMNILAPFMEGKRKKTRKHKVRIKLTRQRR